MDPRVLLEAYKCFEAVIKGTQNILELSKASFYSAHLALKLENQTTLSRGDIALRLLAGLQCSTLSPIEHGQLQKDLRAVGIGVEHPNTAPYSSQQHVGNIHDSYVSTQRGGALEPSISSHQDSHVTTENPTLLANLRDDVGTSEVMPDCVTTEVNPLQNFPLDTGIKFKYNYRPSMFQAPPYIWKELKGEVGKFIKYQLLEGNPRQCRISVQETRGQNNVVKGVFFVMITKNGARFTQAVIPWLGLEDGDYLNLKRMGNTFLLHKITKTQTPS
jgi:hypothetical protein